MPFFYLLEVGLGKREPQLSCTRCRIRRFAKYSLPVPFLLALSALSPRVWANAGLTEASVTAAENAAAAEPVSSEPKPEAPLPSGIHGVVAGKDGELYQGVSVTLTLTGAGNPISQSQVTNSDGAFNFSSLPARPFTLSIISNGFIAQTITGSLHPGEDYDAQTVVLLMAAATADVEVNATQADVALEQFHEEEHQRVIGMVPNYFVTYVQDAPPLSTTQKYTLAWKTSFDPLAMVAAGGFAAMQQAGNSLSGYGQGVEGYAKRFGANYADMFIGTFMGGAVYPALFKQDPRYFYKGTGTVRSRTLYALANAIVCKGDNGRWQFDYSGILGSLTAGGLSNLYYPASDRNGMTVTFENTGMSIAGSAVTNLLQEFFVARITPKIPHYARSSQ
jgi:hypothetical protein